MRLIERVPMISTRPRTRPADRILLAPVGRVAEATRHTYGRVRGNEPPAGPTDLRAAAGPMSSLLVSAWPRPRSASAPSVRARGARTPLKRTLPLPMRPCQPPASRAMRLKPRRKRARWVSARGPRDRTCGPFNSGGTGGRLAAVSGGITGGAIRTDDCDISAGSEQGMSINEHRSQSRPVRTPGTQESAMSAPSARQSVSVR